MTSKTRKTARKAATRIILSDADQLINLDHQAAILTELFNAGRLDEAAYVVAIKALTGLAAEILARQS